MDQTHGFAWKVPGRPLIYNWAIIQLLIDMGVSNNMGTPKWMVYNGKSLLRWMIWEENPLFSETSIWVLDIRMNISKFSRKVCFLSCSNIAEYHVSETNMYLPVSGAFVDTSLTFKNYCNQCLNHTGSMMVFFPSSLRLQAEPLSNKSCVTCAESWINIDQQVHYPFRIQQQV